MTEPPSADARATDESPFGSPWWILGILGFGLATFTHADPDLWGHIRFGLDALDSGRLTAIDRYSFTQDRPWHNHEWLSEAVMALAWRLGGVAGLIVLKATLVTAAASVVWGATRGANWFVRLTALGWLVFGAVHMISTLRPQLWSFLCMAVLARQLLSPSRMTYVVLPVTFAVWANMHGGWFVGLAVLGAWIAGGGVIEAGNRGRTIALALACGAGTLATPYGIGSWTFLLGTVRLERTITEWRPLWEGASVAEWVAWGGTTAMLAFMALESRVRPIARWLVLAVLAVAAFRIMRMGSLYVTVAVVFVGAWASGRWPSGSPRKPRDRPSARWVLVVPAIAVLAAALQLGSAAATCIPTTGPWQPDGQALRFLSSAPAGRLVTTFDWGQYAIWHLGPGIGVSLDGRRETVYSDAHLALHDQVLAATPAGLDALGRWQPDYVWLPQTSRQLRQPLLSRGYTVAIETDRSWLVTRRAVPVPSQSDWRSGCFPY
jgi:hypothetical protein